MYQVEITDGSVQTILNIFKTHFYPAGECLKDTPVHKMGLMDVCFDLPTLPAFKNHRSLKSYNLEWRGRLV